MCTDVIFALLNHTFNRIAPLVEGFKAESRSLNADMDNRHASERTEVLGRAFLAKEMTMELIQEI